MSPTGGVRETTPPQSTFLHELGAIAQKHAQGIAIIDGERKMSYAELADTVQRRSRILVEAGLQPGDRIALVAENSSDFLVAALAVWSGGGVLATIYPSSAPRDLEYCITNSDSVLVLVDQYTETAVRAAVGSAVPVVRIDDRFAVDRLRSPSVANPETRLPLHLICYTSGSTSRPKAVMLSERALLNGARTYSELWHLGPSDRTVVCLPMAWLYGLVSTSMSTLLTGGTVISLRRTRGELIVDAVERHGATFLPGVTTMFTKLVAHFEQLAQHPDLSSLRLCVSSGEPSNEVAFDRWTELTGVPVHEIFCPSECFPLVGYDPVVDPRPVRGSAGKLVPRARMRVVDADGVDVAQGEVGEALAMGPGLMLGYWRDEEQTAAALTPEGWYRTKDLVRVDADGYVYVTGRISDMIIRGGSNVSPAEVERVLRAHRSIGDILVVGIPDAFYGQAVGAVVVLNPGYVLDRRAIAEFAQRELATFKVPTTFVEVDALPQNSTTGKVDRKSAATMLIGAAARQSATQAGSDE